MELVQIFDYDERVEALNTGAFPAAERFSLETFLDAQEKGLLEVYRLEEDGFAGFTVITRNDVATYIFYLAIAEDRRGQGLGHKAISAIQAMNPGAQLSIECEKVTKSTPYESQKMRRRRFYLSQHFHLSHIETSFQGMDFQVMCTGKDLDRKSFKELFDRIARMGYTPDIYPEAS